MITKPGVNLTNLKPEIKNLLQKIEEIFTSSGFDLIVTCGSEAHPEKDPHTHGYAIDLRSKHVKDFTTKKEILFKLQDLLDDNYFIQLESIDQPNEHYHLQVRKDLWPLLLRSSKN